jgi:hypothetical protein
MTNSVKFNGIEVSTLTLGDGKGLFYAQSKDVVALRKVAAATAKVSGVERVKIEWVPEDTFIHSDGTSRTLGGFWKMVASF